MAVQSLTKFFNSKLARRTLLLFVLCSLVPMVLLSILSSRQVDVLYQQQQQQELRRSAKGVGLLLFERLQYLERKTKHISDVVNTLNDQDMDLYLNAQELLEIKRIVVFDFNVENVESIFDQKLDLAVLRHDLLRVGNTVLLVLGEEPDNELWLIYTIKTTNNQKLLGFNISQHYLWLDLDIYDLAKKFKIYSNNNQLIYTSSSSQVDENNDRQSLEIYSNSWDLFLDAKLAAGSWEIRAEADNYGAVSERGEFQQLMLLTTALAILLASLMGAYSIRRSTSPIEALRKGIEHIKNNEFHYHVDIQSGDEFELLGHTFNTMTSKLGQHISAIRSLSAIDQIILNRFKMEDIVEVVLVEGIELLQAKKIYFLVKKKDEAYFSGFNSESSLVPQKVYIEPSELVALHNPQKLMLRSDLNVSSKIVPIRDPGGMLYSSVLNSSDEIQAVLIAHFIKAPDQDLLDIAALFVDHVAVAMANADWEQRLFQQAHYDSLTGLPNRYFFNEELNRFVEQANKDGDQLALFLIGIDDFKSINDSLGHGVGDDVLVEIAQRLVSMIDSGGLLARLSGDEFVLVYNCGQQSRANVVDQTGIIAESLRLGSRRLINAGQSEVQVTVSIGIGLLPGDGDSAGTLWQSASNALYQAKNEGKNSFQYYAEVDNSNAVKRLEFIADLHRAMAENEFELYYQPKVKLKDGSIDGCEALIRWNHPDKGLLSPYFFIPQAEQFGMIGDIGRWVIREAARQQVYWKQCGYNFGRVAVNVSVLQLMEKDFYNDFIVILQDTGCRGEDLEIEITETAYVEDIDDIREHLDKLVQIGITFSVDDYGTGYSSLSLLLHLPVSKLKIDKSFIDTIEDDAISYAIVESTISLARKMGLIVISEGVESLGQLALLQGCNCDNVQGYIFSKPLPVAMLPIILEKNNFIETLSVRAVESSNK